MLAGIYDAFQRWGNQTVWIYSDPHFGDKDLAEGVKNRPSDEEQIQMINSCVGRKDTLIILGDVGDVEAVRKLRGYKILIMGNHDSGASNYKREIATKVFSPALYSTKEQVYAKMNELYPNWSITILPGLAGWVASADNKLFDEVYEGALMVGEKLILSHEPVELPWAFNIHGHDHAGCQRPFHLNVCSDVIGYKPVNLNQFLKSGALSRIQTIHRSTIDRATQRKKKRGKKNERKN